MSRFVGVNDDYKKVLELVNKSLDILWGTGYGISDSVYFGVDGKTRREELDELHSIEGKLKEVKELLNESIHE